MKDIRSEDFITYGIDHIDAEQFHPIKNHLQRNKPTGGLWGCPVSAGWGWKEWCESEDFFPEGSKYFDRSVTWRLREGAKTLVIDSMQDYMKALEQYGISEFFLPIFHTGKIGEKPDIRRMKLDYSMWTEFIGDPKKERSMAVGGRLELDYEKISNDFDAFFLTEKAAATLHHTFSQNYFDFNIWDVGSICLFRIDPDVMQVVRCTGESKETTCAARKMFSELSSQDGPVHRKK